MLTDSRAVLAVLLLAGGCVPSNPDPATSGTTGDDTETGAMTAASLPDPGTSSGPSATNGSSSTTGDDPTLETSSETSERGTTSADASSSSSTTESSSISTSDASSSSSATETSSSTTTDGTTTGDAFATTTETGDDSEGGDLCDATVFRTHVGWVDTAHDGDRFVTVDEAHNLVLWDTATLEVLFEDRNVRNAEITDGVLAYDTFAYDTVRIVDAGNGAPLGGVPFEFVWGVAEDYVWTADGTALRVHETDGVERWSIDGSFGGARVLALADQLHVHAPSLGENEVLHFSADAGVMDSDVFVGTFGGWFDDAPRYWTNQGDAYRVYDVDNTVLVLDLGAPSYGWGTRMVLTTAVVDISDPDTVLAQVTSNAQTDGPAVFWRLVDGPANIVHLDDDPVTTEAIMPICCVNDDYPRFAYADGAWVIGGDDGYVTDHLGRSITSGEAVAIAGSTAGRLALSMRDGVMHIAEVSETCTWDEVSTFPRTGRSMRMAGDGSTLLSIERWQEGWGSNKDGTRIYALPEGELLASYQASVMSDTVVGHDVSDDAAIWSRVISNTGTGQYAVFGVGAGLGGWSHSVPRIAPNGEHVAVTDDNGDPWTTWEDAVTYFYEGEVFTGVVDGVNHGFIDEGHVLVSRYAADCGFDCLSLLGSDIVDMTGAIVAATSLPDIRELRRIDDGAALGVVYPGGDAAIYDVTNSTLLWEAPPGATVEVAGPNHVFLSTGARVEVVAWR